MKKRNVLFLIFVCCFASLFYIFFIKQKKDIEDFIFYTGENKENNYIVCIKNRQEDIIFYEEYAREPTVKVVYDDTFMVIRGQGDWHGYTFINIETSLVSEEFDDINAWNHEKVVYSVYENDVIKIVIQDIYDKEKYYKEVLRNYAPEAIPYRVILDAEFINDSQVILKYYRGEEWEEVSEIIDLN